MREPWGLSGPEFLLIYFLALVASMALVVAARLWAQQSSSGTPVPSMPPLALYELAYFVRGRQAVSETAIAELLHDNAARVDRKGRLVPTRKPAPDPFSASVLASFGSGKHVKRARKAAPASVITPMTSKLHELGLISSPERAKFARVVAWLPAVVLVIGLARLINGILLGRPAGFLVIELLITVVLLAFGHGLVSQPLRTSAGKELANRFKKRTSSTVSAWAKACPGTVRTAAMANVAVLGLVAYPDPAISSILRIHTVSAGSSGGDASSSGGGGCGGGGGGCGG